MYRVRGHFLRLVTSAEAPFLNVCGAVPSVLESVQNKGVILGGSKDQDVILSSTPTIIRAISVNKPSGSVTLLSGAGGWIGVIWW